MSDISNIYSKIGDNFDSAYPFKTKDSKKADGTDAASSAKIPGKTIGTPQLSEKGQKYYEELRKKYHNMEFILVSEDQKEYAKSKAASFAKKNKMVVLIDDAKIEKMASDEAYRKQYEGLIDKAAYGFKEIAEKAASTGANVSGFGMQVKDNGELSYFAVLEKSNEAQTKRIAEKRAKKQAEKKAEAKKEAKERTEDRIKEARENRKTDKPDKTEKEGNAEKSEGTVITANSLEELLRKIEDYAQLQRSDSVVTDAEKKLGQNIDFSA